METFLSDFANAHNVAASTQNLALSAVLFMYREVMDVKLDWVDAFERTKKPKRLPTVLSLFEVQALLRSTRTAT